MPFGKNGLVVLLFMIPDGLLEEPIISILELRQCVPNEALL